jgi:hypothetical protein
MSIHECFAANTLNYPKLLLARYELQDSLAVWPAAGQVVPPDVGAPCLDPDTAADAALLINLRYDMCSPLMARSRRRATLNISWRTPGLDQQGEINFAPHTIYLT